jgi:Holliday junction resolvasome RuvABC ATP-dependent DNA helicase subunit
MFEKISGQESPKRLLAAKIGISKRTGIVINPTMLVGPSGRGKTEMARSIASESGGGFKEVNLAARDINDLLHEMTEAMPHDTILADEFQAVKKRQQDALLPALDYLRDSAASLPPKYGKGDSAKEIVPVNLIIATNRPCDVLDTIRSRCSVLRLSPYNLVDMVNMAKKFATDHNLVLLPQAELALARAGMDSPRVLHDLIRGLARWHSDPSIPVHIALVKQFLEIMGVSDDGLDQIHIQYLNALVATPRCTLSLSAIASRLGQDIEDIETNIEPSLFRRGLVVVCSRGRQLTRQGYYRASSQSCF